jgi:hypothetical protein
MLVDCPKTGLAQSSHDKTSIGLEPELELEAGTQHRVLYAIGSWDDLPRELWILEGRLVVIPKQLSLILYVTRSLDKAPSDLAKYTI